MRGCSFQMTSCLDVQFYIFTIWKSPFPPIKCWCRAKRFLHNVQKSTTFKSVKPEDQEKTAIVYNIFTSYTIQHSTGGRGRGNYQFYDLPLTRIRRSPPNSTYHVARAMYFINTPISTWCWWEHKKTVMLYKISPIRSFCFASFNFFVQFKIILLKIKFHHFLSSIIFRSILKTSQLKNIANFGNRPWKSCATRSIFFISAIVGLGIESHPRRAANCFCCACQEHLVRPSKSLQFGWKL